MIATAVIAFTLAVLYGMSWSKCQREKAAEEAEKKRRGEKVYGDGR